MASVAFDTLQAARVLQEAGIERQQAEAIAQIVSLRGEDHATRSDLAQTGVRIGAKIETKVEQAKNAILRSILTAGIAIIVTLIGGIFAVVA